MGKGHSKVEIPGFTTTPCIEYANTRRRTSEKLLEAHEGLLKSATAYAATLEQVGASLRVFAGSTLIFDNPARYLTPPHGGGDTAATEPSENGERGEKLGEQGKSAEQGENGEESKKEDGKDGDSVSLQPSQGPETHAQEAAAIVPAQRMPEPGAGNEARRQLEAVLQRVEEVFSEIAAAFRVPVQTHLANKLVLSKKAMPSMAPEACRTPEGALEPIGSSMQKLCVWESHIKDMVKSMESIRHEVESSQRGVDKQSTRAAKDPTLDLRKLKTAEGKKNSSQARLDSTEKCILDLYTEVEEYKLRVIFPQIVRLFPLMSDLFAQSQALFDKQAAIAAEVSALGVVVPGECRLPEDPRGISSEAPPIPGAATRPYHEATKNLGKILKEWIDAQHEVNKAQTAYSTALLAWVHATMAAPSDFPRPPAEELEKMAQRVEGGQQTDSFAAMANDWSGVVGALPEAELHESVEGMMRTLEGAKELQVQEVKENKSIEAAKKELAKIETRIHKAQRMETELNKAIEELKDDPEREKEYEARQRQLDKTIMEVQVCSQGLQQSRNKFHKVRASYANLIHEECNTAGSALQEGLPGVFRSCSQYCGAASQSFAELGKKHTTWKESSPGNPV